LFYLAASSPNRPPLETWILQLTWFERSRIRESTELILAHANTADLNGKRFQNFVQRLDFATQEVRSYLKARSRIIQVTDCNDGVLNIAESRIIYESPEQNPPVPIYPVPKRRARRSRKIDEDRAF
jgi:hypothetical protein